MAVIEDGNLSRLTFEEWSERWNEFRSRHPDFHQLRPEKEELMRWHRNRTAEHPPGSFASEWHRERLEALGKE